MSSSKPLFNLPKEVMWRVLGFVDETHRASCAAVARRWSHFGSLVPRSASARMGTGRRASTALPMPNELLVGLVMQFLDDRNDGQPGRNHRSVSPEASSFPRDARRYITRVWASYVAQSRLLAAAAATSATATVAVTAGASRAGLPNGVGNRGAGSLPASTFQFGPETEPGPLDQTGQLPNELLESMFDYLDEDQTMNCASVARRWRASAMELILTSFLSPILWVIPEGAVHNICSNLHPNDISQVACVCQDWRQLASDVPTLAPGLVD